MQNKTKNSDFQKIAKTKTDHSYPQAIEWVLIIVALMALMSCFYYTDFLSTTRHAMNFWKCLAEGEPVRNFYIYNSKQSNIFTLPFLTQQGAAYPFFVYIIFAVWDLPLFIAEHFFGINIYIHSSALYYAKFLMFIFLIFSMKNIKKISLKLGASEEKARWAEYLFLTSAIVFMSIVAMGQYDIFSIFFTLLGIRAYLDDNKIGFIGWFSVAIMCKFFALLIFLPLTLLKNKKLLIAIKDIILVVIPMFILSSLFTMPDNSGENFTLTILRKYWLNNLDISFGETGIILFVAVYFAIIVYSYTITTDDKKLMNIYTVYICAAAYASMILFAHCNFYWYIIIVPYITLLYSINKKYYKLNIMLDTVGMGAFFFSTMLRGNEIWFYDQFVFRPTFLKNIIDFSKIPSGIIFTESEKNGSEIYVWDLVDKAGMKIGYYNLSYSLLIIAYTLFAASLIMIMLINHPKLWYGKSEDNCIYDGTCRGVIHFRTILNTFIISLPIYAIFYSAKNIYHCL